MPMTAHTSRNLTPHSGTSGAFLSSNATPDTALLWSRGLAALAHAATLCGLMSLAAASSAQETGSETSDATLGPIRVSRSAEENAAGQIVDLTHPFDQRTIYWPTEDDFKLQRGPAGVTERGYYYAANRFTAAEHGGTHIDAPIHFFKDRHTVDQIPLQRLIGQAAVVDVTRPCSTQPDYQVGVSDLRKWEEVNGRQLVDVILLLRTGYGRHWKDRDRYLGTSEKGPVAIAKLHFPGLDPVAARWLVDHRAVKAVGIDTASIDFGQSLTFQSHVRLFEHNVPVFENVANLDLLPVVGSTVIALPMKIAGGTGGPLRVIAILPSAR
jgi:kynurenine formamidase